MEIERVNMAVSELVVTDEIRHGDLVAECISDDMSWGEGSIIPPEEYNTPEKQRELMGAVLESIEDVNDSETDMSACTDGRRPVRLMSGEPVPVRKQLVGGNLVSAFYVAESLGDRFYKDPAAPVEDRINEVAQFLADNGKKPSGHISCGAAGGFAAVSANIPRFVRHESGLFVARAKLFLPDGVHDDALHAEMMAGNEQRAQDGTYDDLIPQMFVDAIERVSGKAAIAELYDDGRGVHGHVEEDVVRLRVGNRAINEARLADVTGAREVFGVNDDEMDAIANLFGRGQDEDHRVARMAIEDFANGGHGTLAKRVSTWRVTSVS
jgi:hypothetical protein